MYLLEHSPEQEPRNDSRGARVGAFQKLPYSERKVYEIDKFAMKVAQSNYPDIVELGDAFDLRRPEWELGKAFSAQKENRAD